MNFHYYFRHMSSSEALKFDFEKKMGSGMEGLIHTSTPIHVTFAVEADRHKIHVGLHAKNNTLIEAEEATDDMYKSLDQVMDTLHRRLSREKDRLLRHQHKADPFTAVAQPAVESPGDEFVEEEFTPLH